MKKIGQTYLSVRFWAAKVLSVLFNGAYPQKFLIQGSRLRYRWFDFVTLSKTGSRHLCVVPLPVGSVPRCFGGDAEVTLILS